MKLIRKILATPFLFVGAFLLGIGVLIAYKLEEVNAILDNIEQVILDPKA